MATTKVYLQNDLCSTISFVYSRVSTKTLYNVLTALFGETLSFSCSEQGEDMVCVSYPTSKFEHTLEVLSSVFDAVIIVNNSESMVYEFIKYCNNCEVL